MQPILMILSMLALLMPATPTFKRDADASGLQERSTSSGRRVKQSDLAAVEAYSKGLDTNAIEIYSKTVDRYVKSHPKLTRYYVDALPEGKADSSPAGKKDWYAVKNESEMLDAEREYATRSAVVLTKDGAVIYASLGEPQEHSRHDNEYYFRSDGTLAKLSSDYYSNMAGVHITRENFYDSDGQLLKATTQCFNIITTSKGSREKLASCKKSEMREELRDYKFSIYAKNTELPGYDILKGH